LRQLRGISDALLNALRVCDNKFSNDVILPERQGKPETEAHDGWKEIRNGKRVFYVKHEALMSWLSSDAEVELVLNFLALRGFLVSGRGANAPNKFGSAEIGSLLSDRTSPEPKPAFSCF